MWGWGDHTLDYNNIQHNVSSEQRERERLTDMRLHTKIQLHPIHQLWHQLQQHFHQHCTNRLDTARPKYQVWSLWFSHVIFSRGLADSNSSKSFFFTVSSTSLCPLPSVVKPHVSLPPTQTAGAGQTADNRRLAKSCRTTDCLRRLLLSSMQPWSGRMRWRLAAFANNNHALIEYSTWRITGKKIFRQVFSRLKEDQNCLFQNPSKISETVDSIS